MSKKIPVLLPSVQRSLEALGENIRLARLRRDLSAEMVAERAGISRQTLSALEHGAGSVSMARGSRRTSRLSPGMTNLDALSRMPSYRVGGVPESGLRRTKHERGRAHH